MSNLIYQNRLDSLIGRRHENYMSLAMQDQEDAPSGKRIARRCLEEQMGEFPTVLNWSP